MGGQPGVKGQDHHLIDAAALQLLQLVAQRGNARRRQLRLARDGGKVVARVRLKAHRATGQATVQGFTLEQGQHGLVATVYAVEVAYGQRAMGCDVGMVETAEYFHGQGDGGRRLSPGSPLSWF